MDEKEKKVELETEANDDELDTGAVVDGDGEVVEEKSELELAKEKVAEMTDFAQRLQAEFDNYRKRTSAQMGRIRDDAAADTVIKLFPVVDVIEQALAMITDESVNKGVEMIYAEVNKIFASMGVKEIEAEGKEFDPRIHEAIMQFPAETEEQKDTVKQVFQKGYTMGEKILRPARVIVYK